MDIPTLNKSPLLVRPPTSHHLLFSIHPCIMKKLLSLVALLAFALSVHAEQPQKEVSLEGTGMCAKCELGEAAKCTNALQVTKDNGDVVTYLFTNNLKHTEYFCQGTTEGLVVKGTMVEKDGQKMITATSVEKKG